MNTAIIIAGGSGQRMLQEIPKQFINVFDKPIIIYTLETYQKNENIDSIIIVAIEGWDKFLYSYCNQFNITKLKKIVSGGKTRHDSIFNAIKYLKEYSDPEDIILIADANRPMVSDQIINENINMCKQYGNSLTVMPCTDSMFITEDNNFAKYNIDRSKLYKGQSPESVRFKYILKYYEEAEEKNLKEFSTSALLVHLGLKVAFSRGSEKNLKITTVEDIEIFKSLLLSKKDQWLK